MASSIAVWPVGCDVGRESDRNFRAVAELHQKRFVVRVQSFQKLGDCHLRSPDLLVHAAALVEDQPDRKRRVLA
jgi:hypothetical protein